MKQELGMTWGDMRIAKSYIQAISDESRTIAVNKENYHDPDFYSLLPDLNGKTVLDIGCGNFYMDIQLKGKYPTATFIGLDYPTTFTVAGTHSADENQIKLLGGTADRLPIPDNSIDFVLSSLLFHWLEEAEETANEMKRVLKPEGGFVVSVAHPDYFKAGEFEDNGQDYNFRRKRDTTLPQQLSVMLADNIGPITYYSRPVSDYKTIFEVAGFTNVRLHEPVFTEKEKQQMYPHLNKYRLYPLHLFITGQK